MSEAVAAPARRGTSNGNARGSTTSRRRRRAYLVDTYRADRDLVAVPGLDAAMVVVEAVVVDPVPPEERIPACRCYRCGRLLHAGVTLSDGTEIEGTVTADRIVPGCQGGTYRRTNIRPACGTCNSETGGGVRRKR